MADVSPNIGPMARQSETPPGHWNVLANEVTDQDCSGKPFAGPSGSARSGEILDPMEWEVKLYLALNAALAQHGGGGLGREGSTTTTSDPSRPFAIWVVRRELPLVPGLVEVVTVIDGCKPTTVICLPHIGETAVNTWPGEPARPGDGSVGGRAWILAQEVAALPARIHFVTPAFAGYVSGHSGFSRAAAEVMAFDHGNALFPGRNVFSCHSRGRLAV